jgi:hypothetical protein
MSSLSTFTVVKYIPSQEASYSVLGYGTIGLALAGTFSGGTINIQASNDGATWTTLPVYVQREPLASNNIVTTGNYVASIVSYQLCRLLLTGFSGNLTATASISTKIS